MKTTLRQKILKLVYPLFTWYRKPTAKIFTNDENNQPSQSFYNLSAQLSNGQMLDFSTLKGKKALLVNTASNCGYTAQYAELEKLYEEYKNKLVVIAFPANDFKEQEKGSDAEIAEFCKLNYGVTFPLAKKTTVIKNDNQNEVFKWLTNKSQNGWTNKQPSWNFSKYLVSETGTLMAYFDPAVSPLSKDLINFL